MNVAAWLRQLGLERYEAAFRENDANAAVLPNLTAEDLKELGVTSVGHRHQLLKAITALRGDPMAVADQNSVSPINSTPINDNLTASAAERRQLSVMFCDVIDYTPLSFRLDPEDLSGIIRGYQSRVATTIAQFGGFIARYVGDGILIYFGWPEAHEANAERAVRAALAVIDAMAQTPVLTEPLQVHIGIATGLVVIGEPIGTGDARQQTAIGETPNLAARLQGLAEANSVVIDAATHRQVAGLFDYRDLGLVTLKGLAEPVSAWQVLCPSTVESRFEALRAAMMTPLVGRAEELDLLQRRWLRARSGEGQVVLLSGEPGIGKSRLIVELEQRIFAEPHVSLRYFCSPLYQGSPLRPIIARWERAAGFARGDGSQEKLRKLEAMLLPGGTSAEDIALIADLLSVPTEGRYPKLEYSPQRKKEKLLEALDRWLMGLARTNSVLMLFEDAHWADASTLELLETTVDRLADLPVLLVVSFRPEFSAPWIGRAGVSLIALSRLDRRMSAALATRVMRDHALPVALLDRIVAQTDGVPLFIEELTKTVLESGVLHIDDGNYELTDSLPPLAIPSTLHDSLLARLDRLATARQVAQIGAAIGRDFSYSLIEGVARLDNSTLRGALNQLVRSELVFSRGGPPEAVYTFKHALVRDVAYGTLLRGPRQELHKRIVAVLEDRFAEEVEQQLEILAQHCTLAGLNGRAIDYWNRAGRKSLARSAMIEAAAQFQSSLKLLQALPDGPERQRQELELQGGLGRALIASKGPAAPETGAAYVRARTLCQKLGDTRSLVPLLMGQFAHHMIRAQLDEAGRIAEDVLRLGESENSVIAELAGHQAMGSCLHEIGDFTAAIEHHEWVLAHYDPEVHGTIATIAGYDHQTIAAGLSSVDHFVAGHPCQASARLQKAMSWSRKLNNYTTLCFALYVSAHFNLLRRSEQAAFEALVELDSIATERRYSYFRGVADILRGLFPSKTGDAVERITVARRSIRDQAARGVHHNLAYFLGLLAQAHENAGQTGEALEVLTNALEMADRTGERWFEAELHRLRGEWLFAHGSGPDEAAACFDRALAVARLQNARMWELRATTSLARLRRDQGRCAEARELLAPIHEWFTEGFNTPDLKETKALLDELAGTIASAAISGDRCDT